MSETITRTLTIQNKKGLHARASSRFVQTVETFDADVTVAKGDSVVSGSSILDLMMLAASMGCRIEVSATGSEAEIALNAIGELVSDKFGEGE